MQSNQQKATPITVEKFIKDSIRLMRNYKDTGNRTALAKAKGYFRTVWSKRHSIYELLITADSLQIKSRTVTNSYRQM